MHIRRLALVAPILLAACAGTLGSSGQSRSAASGIQTLQLIEQAAMLGAYSSPRSFDLVAPEYVSALSAFQSAMPKASSDEARAEERDGIRQAFENCIEAVRAQASIHRSSGLSNDPSDFLAIEVCRSAADILERSR